MSLVTLGGGGMLYPHFWGAARNDVDGPGTLIDAAGEKAAFVFRVPRTGTIDRIGFSVRDVTNSQTLRGGLETTDATNFLPTGTQYGGSLVATQTSPVANTFYELTLATAATATRGDIVAIVVQFDATVGSVTIGKIDNQGGTGITAFPFVAAFTAAWAKNAGSIGANSVRYSDGVYEPIGMCVPTRTRADTSFNINSASADEIGNRFTVPAPMRTIGFYSGVGHATATPVDYVLYEGSTVLSTVSVVAGLIAASGYQAYYWDSPVTLAADIVYRLVAKATSTANVNVREAIMLNAGMFNMIPGGAEWHKTSRVDAGVFADDPLRRIWSLGLLIDQVDNGVSAGGGVGPRILTPVGGGGAYF